MNSPPMKQHLRNIERRLRQKHTQQWPKGIIVIADTQEEADRKIAEADPHGHATTVIILPHEKD